MIAGPPGTQRLPRTARLRGSAKFAAIRARGRRVVRGCLVANWATLSPGSRSCLGVVTSRRVGGAVVRSRARRLLREAFRLHQGELTVPVAMVLVARPSIRGKDRQQVERDYLAILRSAGVLDRGGSGREPGRDRGARGEGRSE